MVCEEACHAVAHLDEQLAVLGVEEYDPAPIPYCKRSPCYEGPGFEVPLSDIDPDSDAD